MPEGRDGHTSAVVLNELWHSSVRTNVADGEQDVCYSVCAVHEKSPPAEHFCFLVDGKRKVNRSGRIFLFQ